MPLRGGWHKNKIALIIIFLGDRFEEMASAAIKVMHLSNEIKDLDVVKDGINIVKQDVASGKSSLSAEGQVVMNLVEKWVVHEINVCKDVRDKLCNIALI